MQNREARGKGGTMSENGTDELDDATKERILIVRALNESGYIKSKTAELLGIKRTTLVEKMNWHNIPHEKP